MIAFCDNNESLWGTEYGGINILCPEKCCKENPDAVYVVASRFCAKEIQEQLAAYKIDGKNIVN